MPDQQARLHTLTAKKFPNPRLPAVPHAGLHRPDSERREYFPLYPAMHGSTRNPEAVYPIGQKYFPLPADYLSILQLFPEMPHLWQKLSAGLSPADRADRQELPFPHRQNIRFRMLPDGQEKVGRRILRHLIHQGKKFPVTQVLSRGNQVFPPPLKSEDFRQSILYGNGKRLFRHCMDPAAKHHCGKYSENIPSFSGLCLQLCPIKYLPQQQKELHRDFPNRHTKDREEWSTAAGADRREMNSKVLSEDSDGRFYPAVQP